MNASRIFRNFLNVSQTTEDFDLDKPLSPDETTQIIGYMNFYYGLEEHVVRAMFGTPGLIPEAFVEEYDPDLKPSQDSVNELLGEINKEDVGDFLDAVAKLPSEEVHYPIGLSDLRDTTAKEEEPIKIINAPAASIATAKPIVQVLRVNKKFKGK